MGTSFKAKMARLSPERRARINAAADRLEAARAAHDEPDTIRRSSTQGEWVCFLTRVLTQNKEP